MSKRKSKTQKKKFFAHPKNKNRIFKKKILRDVPVKAGSTLRKRGTFIVLPTSGCNTIPNCNHGPCLLFGERENGSIKSRYFACAVYRSDATACPFKAIVDDDLNIVREEAGPSKYKDSEIVECKHEPPHYGRIPKKY
ncbi:hypothetical protein OSTOST_18448, partial [Ostertagia ostertagi]